ncbi:hypothetical protein D3C85_1783190 [compost metagenome]
MDFVRQGTAVRVAHDEPVSSGFFSLLHDSQRVFRVVLISVEEMLGIENYLEPFLLQIGDRIIDHSEILFQRGLEGSMDMEIP